MMDDPKQPADGGTGPDRPTGKRRWLRALLFVSLALNLAVIGLAVGLMLRGAPPRGPERGGADYVMPYTRALDADQRRAVWRDLKRDFSERRDQHGKDRQDLIQDYRDALAVLRADRFDSAAMMAILDRQSARATERQQVGQQVLNAYLASLTPEARAAYAARLAREIDHLQERRNRWHSDKQR
ncbi:periplasmic heavy metal sensor [Primorskyibacter sp. 2E107]|uniref:periplasmic heavy metal sensor n=1 Tax=Primorskyibacter sp. 2E107 TaxID=3403458 RepID=UPI003AF64C93